MLLPSLHSHVSFSIYIKERPDHGRSPSTMASDPPTPDDTSYVNMTTVTNRAQYADATLVGTHCEAAYCNQLDFLPFKCLSCDHTYCLDHRTEDAHKCANAGLWAERRRLANQAKTSIGGDKTLRDRVSQKPCAFGSSSAAACKTTVGTSLVPGVHCARCNRDYCLKHRLQEDHACDTLTPIGARPSISAKANATKAFGNFKAWISERKEAAGRALPKAKPTSASQRMVAVNDLKKTAKGDEKLAADKRVYLYVEAEAATTTAKLPKGKFYYSKDWVIGRVLDAAAKSLQIENINNQSNKEEDKLRVFHVEGGRVLEFSEKVGTALNSGNTIVLLRGVGPSTPDLIEM